MIAFTRTAAIAPGKQVSAMVFAKEIAAYIKNATDISLDIMVPIGGNPNRVSWSAKHESLGSYEKFSSQLSADPKYLQLVVSGADNFIAGSVEDAIWKVL